MSLIKEDFKVATNERLFHAYTLSEDGSAVDLTNVSFHMQLRVVPNGNLILDIDMGDEIYVVDALTGKFALNVPAAVIAGIGTGNFVHDMIMTRSGNQTRLWSGSLRIEAGITQ